MSLEQEEYFTDEEVLERLEVCDSDELLESDDDDTLEDEAEGGDTYHNKLSPTSPHNKKHKKIAKKCRKCGSTKNIDLHHKSGNRKNLNSTKGIIPLCRSCHRKLHQGKGSSKGEPIEILRDSFDEFLKEFIKDLETPNKETIKKHTPDLLLDAVASRILNADEVDDSLLARANLNKQKDLMYVAFKLVHAGTNKNKDTFLEADLKQAVSTPILKGINWGHSEANVGVIYDTEFVEATSTEPAHILAAAAIWKFKFPDIAKEMLRRFTEGKLFFSMEVWFDQAECSNCKSVFDVKSDICTHLKSRHEGFNTTNRILKDLTFGGAAVVDQPADPLAVGLALAKKDKNKEKGVNLMEKEVQDLQNKLIQAKADVTTKDASIKELDLKIEKLEESAKDRDELFTKLAEAVTQNDGFKTHIDDLETKLSEVSKEAKEYKDKLDTIEAAANARKKADERQKVLAEAGIEFDSKSEDYIDYMKSLAHMDEKSFELMVQTLKISKVKKEDEEPQSAKASYIPTGNPEANTNKEMDNLWEKIFDSDHSVGHI